MRRPYREEGERSPKEGAQRELVYVTGGEGRRLPGRRALAGLALVILVAGALAYGGWTGVVDERLTNFVAPVTIGIVLTLGALGLYDRPTRALTASRKKKKKEEHGLLFRLLDDGDLEIVRTESPKVSLLRVRLSSVRDVRLDTRQIRKVESAAEPGQFMTHQVGPELDVARIQLHIDGRDRPVPLTEAFSSHMDGMEWLGKIRTFLRAHDWLPEDERARLEVETDDDREQQQEEDEDDDEAAGPEEPSPQRRTRAHTHAK